MFEMVCIVVVVSRKATTGRWQKGVERMLKALRRRCSAVDDAADDAADFPAGGDGRDGNTGGMGSTGREGANEKGKGHVDKHNGR